MDRRYVYLLKRTRKNQAKVIDYAKVWDAAAVERRIHRLYESQRFEMKKTKGMPWIGVHVKVGITEDMDKRLATINKSALRSGRTEWFHLYRGDVVYLSLLLSYYQILPFIRLAFIIAVLLFFIIAKHNL